jgi:hypothetical protein
MMHSSNPDLSAYVPLGHTLQETCLEDFWNVPGSQGMHFVCPDDIIQKKKVQSNI